VIGRNGEFTHTKLGSSKDECEKICSLLCEKVRKSNRTLIEKQVLIYFLCEATSQGCIPMGLLLEIYWPSTTAKFKKHDFADDKSTVTFDLPERYKCPTE
jgi:hypothetical protein